MKALAVLLLPSLLLAYVAKVVSLDGKANVHIGTTQASLLLNDTLDKGTRVVTASGSKVKLVFTDDTVVTIGPNSDFLVEDYSESTTEPKALFNIKRGAFKILTGNIAKVAPERFKFKTKTGVIGVRGTYFAVQYKDDTLGLLYLGRGNGVVISNEAGETVLDEIGDGVFMRRAQMPPAKEKWNSEQVHVLLQNLTMADEQEEKFSAMDEYKIGGSVRYVYQYEKQDIEARRDRHEAVAIINASSPRWQGMRVNGALYHRNNLYNHDFETEDLTVLGEANLEYDSHLLTAVVGRQELATPLTATSTVKPDFGVSSFEAWDKGAAVHDWWWDLPSNFEAAYLKVSAIEDMRFHAAFVNRMRKAQDEKFTDASEHLITEKINNDDNSSEMFLWGAQHIWEDKLKTEYWGYLLSDLLLTNYLEVKYRYGIDDGALLAAGQVIKQDGAGSVNQQIDSWLVGARLGVEKSGAFVTLSYTQTSVQKTDEVNKMLMPFDATVAYTNAFVFGHGGGPGTPAGANGALSGFGLKADGPYGSDTSSYLLSAGYDFARLGLYGLELFGGYGVYDKKDAEKAELYNLDMTYSIPQYEWIAANLKYSNVKNIDFADSDFEHLRFVVGVYF